MATFKVNLDHEPVELKDCPLQATPGTVVIAVHNAKSSDSLIITDEEMDNRLPSCGLCIASGVDGVNVGDTVVVDPTSGKWIVNAYGYSIVRFLGCEGTWPSATRENIWRYCMAKIEDTGQMKPYGNNVLIKRDAVRDTTDAGVVIPGSAQGGRAGEAVVVAVGDSVKDVAPGDRVVYYSQGAQCEPSSAAEAFYGADKGSLLILEDKFILALVCEKT